MYTYKVIIDKRGVTRRNFYRNGKRVAMGTVPKSVLSSSLVSRKSSVSPVVRNRVPATRHSFTPRKTVYKITELRSPRRGCVATIKGGRDYQEDRYSITEMPGATLYSVFDGHGGSKTSEILRREFNKYITTEIKNRGLSSRNFRGLMDNVARQFDNYLLRQRVTDGSTAVGVIVTVNRVYLWTIGDSRAVILDSADKVVAKTTDHKPNRERSRISSTGGYVSGGRVNGILATSRSFGDFSLKHVARTGRSSTVIQSRSAVTAIPSTASVVRKPGMKILVATDGVWDANIDASKLVNLGSRKGNICNAILKETAKYSSDNATIIYAEI